MCNQKRIFFLNLVSGVITDITQLGTSDITQLGTWQTCALYDQNYVQNLGTDPLSPELYTKARDHQQF